MAVSKDYPHPKLESWYENVRETLAVFIERATECDKLEGLDKVYLLFFLLSETFFRTKLNTHFFYKLLSVERVTTMFDLNPKENTRLSQWIFV